MVKHTPGPWAATTRKGSWDWLVFKPGTPLEICQMFHDGSPENETGEANAKLVAASPDLLAALKNLVASRPVFRLRPMGAPGSAARLQQEHEIILEDEALAAIAKAESA